MEITQKISPDKHAAIEIIDFVELETNYMKILRMFSP